MKNIGKFIAPLTASGTYKNFDKFAGNLRARRKIWNTETLPTTMLERIARNRPDAAKKIFDVACVQLLHQCLREHHLEVEISEDGKKWVESAKDRFLQEPGWSIGVLEGVLLLELAEPQAREDIKNFSQGRLTFEQFLEREATESRKDLAEKIFGGAYRIADTSLAQYVQVRAYFIALVITACVDGGPLTDKEIWAASAHRVVDDEARGGTKIDRQASLPTITTEIETVIEGLLGVPFGKF